MHLHHGLDSDEEIDREKVSTRKSKVNFEISNVRRLILKWTVASDESYLR